MKVSLKSLWSLAIVSVYFVAGKALMACATCSKSFSQDKIDAYKISTALLVSLPFIIMGLIIFYVVKKSKARKLTEEE